MSEQKQERLGQESIRAGRFDRYNRRVGRCFIQQRIDRLFKGDIVLLVHEFVLLDRLDLGNNRGETAKESSFLLIWWTIYVAFLSYLEHRNRIVVDTNGQSVCSTSFAVAAWNKSTAMAGTLDDSISPFVLRLTIVQICPSYRAHLYWNLPELYVMSLGYSVVYVCHEIIKTNPWPCRLPVPLKNA